MHEADGALRRSLCTDVRRLNDWTDTQIRTDKLSDRIGEVDAKARIIADVCRILSGHGPSAAAALLDRQYPFRPEGIIRRRFRPLEYTRVFIRDGFLDRYTGERLLFPPVLRLLSWAMPDRLPYHPNWKTDVAHPAYWEVGATVDHLVPVTRGGADVPENWMTTSMARNSAKMNWTLAEVGWHLHLCAGHSRTMDHDHDHEASGHGRQRIDGEDCLGAPRRGSAESFGRAGVPFLRGGGDVRWVCAVAKQTEDLGFLITAYPTDAIKEGNRLWPK